MNRHKRKRNLQCLDRGKGLGRIKISVDLYSIT